MPESGMVKVRSLAGARRLAIIEALTIGVVAGLAGLAVKYGVSAVGSFRLAEAARLPHMVGLPLFGLLGGLLSGWLVERVAPETTGSGIPQVKASLAGERISLDRARSRHRVRQMGRAEG